MLRAGKTIEVQLIANQTINSHYWQNDYFRKAKLTDASRRTNGEFSGQDYLFVYWMGRCFGLISDEEATAPITWENQLRPGVKPEDSLHAGGFCVKM